MIYISFRLFTEKKINTMAKKTKNIRRKTIVRHSQEKAIRKISVGKPFCLPFMQRYDGYDVVVNDYTIIWRCMICKAVFCTELVATRHSEACRKKLGEVRKKKSIKPPTSV